MKYLTIFNSGYIEFTINNILNYIKIFNINESTLELIAIDDNAYDSINVFLQKTSKENDISNIKLKKDIMYLTGYENFNTKSFIDIMHKKIKIILKETNNTDYLHYFDGDVAFFKDPTHHIKESLQNCDIIFQQDAPYEHHHNRYHNYVCAGNFSIKSNKNSINFLENVISRLNPNQNDQEVLYTFLNSNCNNIKEYKDCILDAYDQELFQNGCDAFQYDWYLKPNKISIHANHMIGSKSKKEALTKASIWYNII